MAVVEAAQKNDHILSRMHFVTFVLVSHTPLPDVKRMQAQMSPKTAGDSIVY